MRLLWGKRNVHKRIIKLKMILYGCFIVSGLWTQNTPQKKKQNTPCSVISLISNNETLKRQNVLVPMKRFM